MLRMQALPLSATASRPCGIWQRPVGELSRACCPAPLPKPGWPTPPASTVQPPAGLAVGQRGAEFLPQLACRRRADASQSGCSLRSPAPTSICRMTWADVSAAKTAGGGEAYGRELIRSRTDQIEPSAARGNTRSRPWRDGSSRRAGGSVRTVFWLQRIVDRNMVEPATAIMLCAVLQLLTSALWRLQGASAASCSRPPLPAPSPARALDGGKSPHTCVCRIPGPLGRWWCCCGCTGMQGAGQASQQEGAEPLHGGRHRRTQEMHSPHEADGPATCIVDTVAFFLILRPPPTLK